MIPIGIYLYSGIYWKGLYKDYKDVAVDVVTECKERPIKSTIYVLGRFLA